MTVSISAPALNLRERLAKLANLKPAPARTTHWTSGNGATTSFPLARGWKPENVWVNGALMRPGAGEDYTIAFDGFVHSVVFAVAPAAVDIAITATQEL